MSIKLTDEYIIVCLSDRPFPETLLTKECPNKNISMGLYGSEKVNVAILSCFRHLEPLLNLLSWLMERKSDFVTFTGARILLADKSQEAGEIFTSAYRDMTLKILDYRCFNLPKSFDDVFTENTQLFDLYLMLGGKICLTYPSCYKEKIERYWQGFMNTLTWKAQAESEEFSLKNYSDLRKQDSCYVPDAEGKAKKTYDIMAGRISEARNWTRNNIDRTKEIGLVLKNVIDSISHGRKLIEDCKKIEEGLHEIEANVTEVMNKRKDRAANDQETRLQLLGAISEIEGQLFESDTVIQRLSLFTDPLKYQQMKMNPNPLDQYLLLKCCGVAQDDILTSLGMTPGSVAQIVEYESVGPHLLRTCLGNKSVCFLSFPQRFLHRLGLYPLMAHGLSQLLIDSDGPQSRKISSTIRDMKAYSVTRMNQFVRNLLKYTTLSNEQIQNLENDVITAYYELFSDLVATTVMGPAYLYALYRKGNLLRTQPTWDERGGPQFGLARLVSVDNFLRKMNVSPRLPEFALSADYSCLLTDESKYLSEALDLSKIIDFAFDLNIPDKYNNERHQQSLEAKKDLLSGKICNADSIIILNALWDAVFDAEGYVNEVAAFISILNRAYRPTGNEFS